MRFSTLRYPGWEAFARQLDKPLASFIRIYHPSFFQRVGLRYVNIVSRSRLGLEDADWADLFALPTPVPFRRAMSRKMPARSAPAICR